MGQYHSHLMMELFPGQKATGLDLGNVEIKECFNEDHKYSLKGKDSKADFMLFFDQMDEIFFIVNGKNRNWRVQAFEINWDSSLEDDKSKVFEWKKEAELYDTKMSKVGYVTTLQEI